MPLSRMMRIESIIESNIVLINCLGGDLPKAQFMYLFRL